MLKNLLSVNWKPSLPTSSFPKTVKIPESLGNAEALRVSEGICLILKRHVHVDAHHRSASHSSSFIFCTRDLSGVVRSLHRRALLMRLIFSQVKAPETLWSYLWLQLPRDTIESFPFGGPAASLGSAMETGLKPLLVFSPPRNSLGNILCFQDSFFQKLGPRNFPPLWVLNCITPCKIMLKY